MTLHVDPEIADALAGLGGSAPAHTRGDWRSLRDMSAAGMRWMTSQLPPHPDVHTRTDTATSTDGHPVMVRWYQRQGPPRGSAVVVAHGGGLVGGSMDLNDGLVAGDVSATGVPALSVDYRLAPEARGATPAHDVLAGVRWVVDHAEDLGVDPARIAVMGESSGGGLDAAAAVLARDAGIRLARQILSYPMLDDRTTTTDPQLSGLVTWDWDMNWTGWHALLDNTPDLDSAVPARVGDLTGLAPAYLDVGDIDILRDETVQYAQRLARAGVPTELHVRPGAIHGFDRFVPTAAISRQSTRDRRRALTTL